MKKMVSLGLLALLPAFAQQPKFDLADVHISKTAYWFAQTTPVYAVIRDGRYIYRDATLLKLIQAAYSVTDDAVAGGPSWLASDLFDVIAKVPEGTTLATANLMLQPLLAERFALAIRRETRPLPRYVLSVGKGGSKLKPAAASEDSGCRQQPFAPGAPSPQGGPPALPNLKFTCHNLTAQQIADNIRQMAGGYTSYLNHDVVNATKLEGAWDFDLEFTLPGAPPDQAHNAITLFEALSKQLGLLLELKDVPVPALVIAGVNRKPASNPPEAATGLALAEARFEAATIKPVDPSQPRFTGLRYAGGSQMRAGGTLRSLLALSLQIQPNASNDVIVGLPKSADSQFWDITAKLPSSGEGAPMTAGARPQPPPLSVALEMLRGLLVDQFALKTHTENREATVYALMQGGGKLKLTRADPSERSDCKPDPNAPKPFPNIGTMVNCKNITMAEFARNLEQATGFFDHPIVDATGLQGGWSFLLGWSSANQLSAPRPNPSQPAGAAPEASDPTGGISSYDAVQKELGLKLVKQKRSIPVIVVDQVAEKPIE